MRNIKARKGMTLIETIIGVTLLSILVVPLSNVVLSSLKNNLNSEDRQKASYIGQKVLEELKAYDEIKFESKVSGEKYFTLLDGDEITQVSDGNFTGSFKRNIYGKPSNSDSRNEDIYDVSLELWKNEKFQYYDINNLEKNKNSSLVLNFYKEDNEEDNIIKFNKDKEPEDIKEDDLDKPNNDTEPEYTILIAKENANSIDLIMEIDEEYLNIYKDKIEAVEKNTLRNIGNKITLYIKNEFSEKINIEVKNNTSKALEIHVIKYSDKESNFNMYSSAGKLILYEDYEIQKNTIADMYNYKITVADISGNVLFEGDNISEE